MPELPELTVIQEVLQRRVGEQQITTVELMPAGAAIVVRDLTQLGFSQALTGATIKAIARRDKFLVFTLHPLRDSPLYLVLNPKLAGRLQLAEPGQRRMADTIVVLSLSSGSELRYVDQKRMGQLYLVRDLNEVPDYRAQGPEPFEISAQEFSKRLRPFRGEIKGVLTRGDAVAGIGNAYADEILWEARLNPFRKRTQLTQEETDRLYMAMQVVLANAIAQVRAAMGEAIHQEPRDFMHVHLRGGKPCPRCGTSISTITAHQRITNFCRTCQPGGLIRGI